MSQQIRSKPKTIKTENHKTQIQKLQINEHNSENIISSNQSRDIAKNNAPCKKNRPPPSITIMARPINRIQIDRSSNSLDAIFSERRKKAAMGSAEDSTP